MIQPVTNTMPQMYSCMPVAPATYTTQAVPQNNAVKIDIHNPSVNTQPAYNPYVMPQSSLYTAHCAQCTPYITVPNCCPQAAIPQPVQTVAQPVQIPQTINTIAQPVQINEPIIAQNAVKEQPITIPVAVQPKEIQQPQPIVIPPSVVVPQPVITNQPQIINAPQIPVAAPAPVLQQTAETVPVQPVVVQPVVVPASPEAQGKTTAQAKVEVKEATPPKVESPASAPVNIDLNQIVSKLNSTNTETQLAAIESIAETVQANSPAATQLLDTQIMDSLSAIIKRDTTQMQAPTPEQIKLRQKLLAGETLTPEQTAAANQLSEMETAERNKQFAIYTVAILQKLLSTEVEKAQGTKLELKDLPMIIDIVKIAKNDPNPMLRASALASLSYIATPENKQLMTTMFEQSTKDADPNVQAVAAKALNQLSQI